MLIEDLKVVLKISEFLNITAAADSLGMRPATASAALKRVESYLGIEIFTRTTRHLRLSSAGEKYIPKCEQALQILDDARQGSKSYLDVIDGEIRISVSSDLGRNQVLFWLDEFMERNPKISLNIHISDRKVDFYRDSVDIAVRYGYPSDSSMYGFKICSVPRVLCATQEYLDKHGVPRHPHDLSSHSGLFYQLGDLIHKVWKFHDGDSEYKVKMKGDHVANDGDIVRRWCVAGKGIAVKSVLDMASDLLSGKVISVMPNFTPESTELWIVCPSRQSITPAVRLLRDSLKKHCKDLLYKVKDYY